MLNEYKYFSKRRWIRLELDVPQRHSSGETLIVECILSLICLLMIVTPANCFASIPSIQSKFVCILLIRFKQGDDISLVCLYGEAMSHITSLALDSQHFNAPKFLI